MKKPMPFFALLLLLIPSGLTADCTIKSFQGYKDKLAVLKAMCESSLKSKVINEIKALEFCVDQQVNGLAHSDRAEVYHEMGVLIFIYLDEYEIAIELFDKALKIRKEIPNKDSVVQERIITGMLNIGQCYYYGLGDIDKAQQYINSSLKLHVQFAQMGPYKNDIVTEAKIIHALSQINTDQGKFDLARLRLEHVVQIYSQEGLSFKLGQAYLDLSNLFRFWEVGNKMEDYARKALNEFLTVYNSNPKYLNIEEELMKTYRNWGIGLELTDQLQQASLAIDKSDHFISFLMDNEDRKWEHGSNLNNRSIVERKKNIASKALEYATQALAINNEFDGLYPGDDDIQERLSTNYNNLGQAYALNGQMGKALSSYEAGIGCLVKDFNHYQDSNGNPKLTDPKIDYIAPLELLDLLYQKALVLAETNRSDPAFTKAFATYQVATDLADRFLASHPQQDVYTRGRVLGLTKKVYEGLIALNFKLAEHHSERAGHYWQKAFAMAEKSKSIALNTFKEIPADQALISISRIQEEILDSDQALVEYFVGTQSVYVWMVTQTEFTALVLPQDQPGKMKKDIKTLIQAIKEIGTNGNSRSVEYKEALRSYSDNAYAVFKQLIQPLRGELHLPDRWIIIPDEELNLLPFESLLVSEPDETEDTLLRFAKFSYLFQELKLSYAYSAKMLQQMQQRPASHIESLFLGVAPLFRNIPNDTRQTASTATRERGKMDSLAYNRQEVKEIFQLLKGEGTILLNHEATKEAFLKLAENYRILHLSSHGIADQLDGYGSYLAFFDSLEADSNVVMYANEILALSLQQCDMVVISACETVGDDLWRGLGLVGLSRAFAYAGTKSVVPSLWSVNDQKTAQLLKYFYKELKNGLPKDQALQKAKMKYIDLNSGKESQPYLWAPFIIIGDTTPLFKPSAPVWPYVVVGALFLLGLLYFLRKKRGI